MSSLQASIAHGLLSHWHRSLADQDTDRWVHETLAPHLRVRMKSLKSKVQFTDLW